MTPLATTFRRRMLAQLGAETCTEIDRRNATPAYADCCASHDYCDANEIMLSALRSETGAQLDSAAQLAALMPQINTAWSAARAHGFAPQYDISRSAHGRYLVQRDGVTVASVRNYSTAVMRRACLRAADRGADIIEEVRP